MSEFNNQIGKINKEVKKKKLKGSCYRLNENDNNKYYKKFKKQYNDKVMKKINEEKD